MALQATDFSVVVGGGWRGGKIVFFLFIFIFMESEKGRKLVMMSDDGDGECCT